MKNQMQTNLFAVAVGLTLFGVITTSTTSEHAEPVPNQQAALKGQKPSAPAATTEAAKPPKIPFTFFLTMVTTFANGGSIDFDLFGGEEESIIWPERLEWAKAK